MPDTQPIAKITKASFSYPAGNNAVVDINMSLFESEIVGLIGPNGCGKTTLFKLISGYMPVSSGTIELGGTLIEDYNERMLSEFVTMVEQNPENQLAGPTVEDELARSSRLMGLKGRAIEENVTRVLRDVNLADAREWFIDEISTGERRRVALGLSLLGLPKLLLLDEPFSDLDEEGISATVDFLNKYKEKNVSILISSHKLDDLLKICDRIAILENNTIGYIHEPEQVIRNKELLQKTSLKIPDIPALFLELEAANILSFEKCPVDLTQAKSLINKVMKRK
ncbi:MAG: ABC transporter ATP-binding protein [Fibrobacteria bacterium]|nr:ABC transporter ATP-binding protein [Fibrobacteria bacterium]